MNKHELYMKRCLELAIKAEGHTWPNPLVGAVIVHEDKIIGEGWHHKAGTPHAEINAINSVKDRSVLKNSSIYVSLEPCSHFGRTPPCALALREADFKEVIVGMTDPNDKVNGGGIALLREAGIKVTTGILENECLELNRRFITFHQKQRPHIVLKWAQSADGYLDQNFQTTQIGNSLTRQLVHNLRAREQAILVGAGTAVADNPALTVREISGPDPLRIVLDPNLRVPQRGPLFSGETPTLVFNKVKTFSEGNVRFIKVETADFLKGVLHHLYEKGVQSVLVEGGAFTHNEFIKNNLWDEAVCITNPALFLQNGTPTPALKIAAKQKDNFRDNMVSFYSAHGN